MAGMVEKVEKMGTQKGYAETRTPNEACHPLAAHGLHSTPATPLDLTDRKVS